jgi:hypothetical protein
MKGRKGIALNNTMTMLIAIIGILILAYAGYKIVNFYSDGDSENAGMFLDSLMGKIDLMDNGEGNTFLISGVKGDWALVGWGEKEAGRPEKCFLNGCVCVCPFDKVRSTSGAEECQDRGICREINNQAIGVSSYTVYEGNENIEVKDVAADYYNPKYWSRTFSPLEGSCIGLGGDPLAEITVHKEKDLLVILRSEREGEGFTSSCIRS